MHLHILGIGGTFMSALAILAREAGYTVTGCDLNCYPPISELLKDLSINWHEGYDDATLALKADCVIVGNAIKRNMPVIEAVLDAKRPFFSGPDWLRNNILPKYRVIAVAGTHGKTTTTSMVAHILQEAGLQPGFLIGGVSSNFNTSASLGKGEWFVIEADEYDSAFFDKRPKFMHYQPEIAILNNLEFDHADIYDNLDEIEKQFHFLLRTIPKKGTVIAPLDDMALNRVFTKGIYSNLEHISCSVESNWHAKIMQSDASQFAVFYRNEKRAEVYWNLLGSLNVENALAAIAACSHAGVSPEIAALALQSFKPAKRRLEIKYQENGITIYDDFAHHPTAIAKTLAAIRASDRHKRIIVAIEFASFTMRTGVHKAVIANALAEADALFILTPKDFELDVSKFKMPVMLFESSEDLAKLVADFVASGDALVFMSNRGFGGAVEQCVEILQTKAYI